MLNVNKLTFSYPFPSQKRATKSENTTKLMQFDFKLQQGERLAIVGGSGEGKSTLLNLLAGFLQPKSGEIVMNNQDHTYSEAFERPISILFQQHNLFNHLTVAENITLGIKANLSINSQQQQLIQDIAEQVQIPDLLKRYPHQLSGGQQQRVAIARCMLRDKPILLLDEPFSALDPQLRAEMVALIDQIARNKSLTLVLVSHQIEEVKPIIDFVTTIKDGINSPLIR